MTGGDAFIEKAKCKNEHCSFMSNSAWCDFNSKADTLKKHDICHNPKCIFQKQITFTSKQFQFGRNGFEKTMKKLFKRTENMKMWNSFRNPGLKRATPIVLADVVPKTKNPQSAQIPSSILKSLTGGKTLSLAELHGNGLRLKVI